MAVVQAEARTTLKTVRRMARMAPKSNIPLERIVRDVWLRGFGLLVGCFGRFFVLFGPRLRPRLFGVAFSQEDDVEHFVRAIIDAEDFLLVAGCARGHQFHRAWFRSLEAQFVFGKFG